ncbi:hypothetical protein SORBI_3005G210200 [Sorghum bicolor]|uniref:Protein kinase domain-containing protein n=1 Tax=Sorghum bicolor TaxID=4558 RepID=A0A1Z5RKK0_SORBI|nr:hypothetical protein SORBI_3005G210200 [Sorghum bicolor]
MSFRCLLRAQLSDPEDFVGVFRRCSSQSSVCVQGEHKVFVEMPRRLGSERTVHAARIKDKVSQAAQTVRHNKKTCQQLVHHVQIIGDLLKKLQTPEMMEHPETRNGLNNLEEILREAYMLVTSCQNNNYVYHLFTGKKQADQFRILQNRMNSCLQVFPLISHIDTTDRLDKILEIIRPPCSQVVRDVPRLLAGCSSCDTSGRTEVYGQVKRCSLQLNCAEALKFSLSQLVDATNNFSDRNLIGKGSFGCVYKGQLHDGLEVAVKRCFELPSSPNQLDVQDYEFQNEICFLPRLQHTNIIKLLGDTTQERKRILVYEYMPNGSLDSFIFGARTSRLHLDWPTRFQIIKGIAEGMLYLHKLCGLHIIHGDLKPSNILLDTNMKPKISDFGLSRTYNPGVDEEFADRIVGSIGFTAPECQERRVFSVKSDVYGFGALLLEIISGHRCFSLASGESGGDHGFLNKRAWKLWRAGGLIKFVDSPPGDESERMEVLRCIQIALLCVEENPANRPTMQEVVLMLRCHKFVLPTPQHPAYLRAAEMVRTHS